MRQQSIARRPSRRQHYVSRFYLRNFAEPVLSDNLWVFDIPRQRWDRRTPDGVGWLPHLYTTIEMDGSRRSEFDQIVKEHVEDVVAPVFRKLATGEPIGMLDRFAVASFLGMTAARSPAIINTVIDRFLGKQPAHERELLDALTDLWINMMLQKPTSRSIREFLKPSVLGAAWCWGLSIKYRVFAWPWQLIRTGRDTPFVTSDAPVYLERHRPAGVEFVSFPISSELALVAVNGADWRPNRNPSLDVAVINRQTTRYATKFVAACRDRFTENEFACRTAAPHSRNEEWFGND